MKTSIKQKNPLILIADDDRSTIILLRAILQKEGCRVIETSNGEECIKTYQQEKPDLVILDAVMPILDGFTCCQKIKALNSSTSPTPIIMITGLDGRKSVDQAFQVGATDYINKPIHPSILRQRLLRTLEAKWAEEALRESENKYRFLVDNLKEVIFQIDSQGNLIFLNPIWSEITGFSVSESLNNPLSNFIHPKDDLLYRQKLTSLVEKQEKNIYFQARFLKKSGGSGWMEFYAYPVLFNDKSLVKISGTINDITQRKYQEKYQNIENSVAKVITNNITCEEALSEILRIFCIYLDWELGEFWQIDSETKLLSYKANYNQFLDEFPQYIEQESNNKYYSESEFLDQVLSENNFILAKVNNQDLSIENTATNTNLISFQTVFGFPIVNGDEQLGVITLFSQKIQKIKFILPIVTAISSQIGQFIKRKQTEEALKNQHIVLQSELTQASNYVRSLLPSPLTDKVKIKQYFLPSIQLGGDIFDYYWLDEQNLAMYLLDVAGHGVRPALLSVSIHNILRSQSLYNTDFYEPWTVLTELNRVFQMDKNGNDYFTIWYGVYNLEKRELTYSCAAHPPAILLGSDTKAITTKKLSTENIAIGMFSQFNFEQKFVQIEPNNTLYIFSDGIYEIPQANGQLWGLDAFVDTVKQYYQNHNTNLEQVVYHVQEINGNKTLDDDLSLIQLTFP